MATSPTLTTLQAQIEELTAFVKVLAAQVAGYDAATGTYNAENSALVTALPNAYEIGESVWGFHIGDINPSEGMAGYDLTHVAEDVWGYDLTGVTAETATVAANTLEAVATSVDADDLSAAIENLKTTVNDTTADIDSAVAAIQTDVTKIAGYTDELETLVGNLPTKENYAAGVWNYLAANATTEGSLGAFVQTLATSAEVTALDGVVDAGVTSITTAVGDVNTAVGSVPANVWSYETRENTNVAAIAAAAAESVWGGDISVRTVKATEVEAEVEVSYADIASAVWGAATRTITDNTLDGVRTLALT